MNCPDCCYQDWCAGAKLIGKLTLCEAHPFLFGQNDIADETDNEERNELRQDETPPAEEGEN